ncbi:hypothetical protein LXA43DRAFT_1066443 [Ganoderma leucocontextum]|nr:hypothetical protein LXA43DRAFT_1066443 [Ganoderma leucocontextum]
MFSAAESFHVVRKSFLSLKLAGLQVAVEERRDLGVPAMCRSGDRSLRRKWAIIIQYSETTACYFDVNISCTVSSTECDSRGGANAMLKACRRRWWRICGLPAISVGPGDDGRGFEPGRVTDIYTPLVLLVVDHMLSPDSKFEPQTEGCGEASGRWEEINWALTSHQDLMHTGSGSWDASYRITPNIQSGVYRRKREEENMRTRAEDGCPWRWGNTGPWGGPSFLESGTPTGRASGRRRGRSARPDFTSFTTGRPTGTSLLSPLTPTLLDHRWFCSAELRSASPANVPLTVLLTPDRRGIIM